MEQHNPEVLKWDNIWSHRVHEKLGEALFYYFIQVRPFDPERAKVELDELVASKELGSVRAFPIFGPYDLLVRIWLHPSLSTKFPEMLDSALRGVRDIAQFSVTHIYHRWYSNAFQPRNQRDPDRKHSREHATTSSGSLLDTLDDSAIKSVERGENLPQMRSLVESELLIKRPERPKMIRFFVPIRFAENTQGVLLAAVRELSSYLQGPSPLKAWSLYGGYGFCSLLVSGSVPVEQYQDVATLPNWIGDRFKVFGASTETYLAHGHEHLIVDDHIAEATFREIRGKDLFVHSILPEVYDFSDQTRIEEVEEFLKTRVRGKRLSPPDRNLIHDILLAYLQGAVSEMIKSFVIFFIELEAYLRDNLMEFIGRGVNRPMKEVLDEVDITKDKGRFHTLGDLMKAYEKLVPQMSTGADAKLNLNTAKLVWVRNQVTHEGVNVMGAWRDLLGPLIDNLAGVRVILAAVQKVTNRPFAGTY